MKTKIIAAAVILSALGIFSCAGAKENSTIGTTDTQKKQIGTEHYILGGKYYTVRKFAPDIESDDKALIERSEFLNDQIEIALQNAQKFEKHIPQEYREFSQEKFDAIQKEINKMQEEKYKKNDEALKKMPDDENEKLALFYKNLAILESKNLESKKHERALQKVKKLEKYIPEEYKEFPQEAFDKIQKDLERKREKLGITEENKTAQNMQPARKNPKNAIPDDENEKLALFYNKLLNLEEMNTDFSRDSNLRKAAYKAKAQYYHQKKYGFTTVSYEDALVSNAYKAKAEYYSAKYRKDFRLRNYPSTSHRIESEFEEWKNRVIVAGIKKTVKMEPSGFIVPDILHNNLKKIKIKPFKIDENDINFYALPAIKHCEYYSTKGNIADFGIDLFYFEFEESFSLFADEPGGKNIIFLQTAIEKILQQRPDVSSFFSRDDNSETIDDLYSSGSFRIYDPSNLYYYLPDDAKLEDLTQVVSIRFQGKDNKNKPFPEISGQAATKGKGTKAWAILARGRAVPKYKTMMEWYSAEGTDLYVDIDMDGTLLHGQKE